MNLKTNEEKVYLNKSDVLITQYCSLFPACSKFRADTFGYLLSKLVSKIEEDDYVFFQAQSTIRKKNIQGIVKDGDSYKKNGIVLQISDEKEYLTFYKMEDDKKSQYISLYSSINFTNFPYLKDFIDKIIGLRIAKDGQNLTDTEYEIVMTEFIRDYKGKQKDFTRK